MRQDGGAGEAAAGAAGTHEKLVAVGGAAPRVADDERARVAEAASDPLAAASLRVEAR